MSRARVVLAAVLAAACAASAASLEAQDSHFGIRGLGAPGRWESVRARATGGAFAPFDAFSPLTAAALADVRRMSAGVTGGTSWRSVQTAGSDASFTSSRFPALVVAGPLNRRISIAAGFSTYLDKSFGITTVDTILLRGEPEGVRDEVTSDGGVTDLRLAVAARLHRRVAVGFGLHGLTGSTRVVATRTFDDTANYSESTARDEIAYEGFGGSASVLVDPSADFRLALWARSDTKLRADVRGNTVAEDDLPFAAGAGVRWRAGSSAMIAGAVAWRYWGGGGATNAFDTFTWSLGAELGSQRLPLRFGARGGDVPFGPSGTAPTELTLAAGFGRQFSGDRGRLDFTVERLERKGGGLTERVWSVLMGLTVRP